VKTGLIKGGLSLILFLFSFAWHARLPVVPDADLPQGDAYRAFEWWYSQRALPYSHIPPGAIGKADAWKKIEARKNALRRVNAEPDGRAPEDSPTSAWESLGPVNVGGRVLSIAIHPVNTGTVFAGSASGGLWKTTTGGEGAGAWSRVATGFPVLSVSAIAFDPVHPDTVYIGTGEISRYVRPLIGVVGARSSYGIGILRSTDGGSTWDTTGLNWSVANVTAVQKIVVNPLNSSTLFAATSEGVYASTDAGDSWTLSNPVLMAMDIVLDPVDTTILVSSHGNMNSSPDPGIYRTTDAGSTWSKVTTGLPGVNFGRTALAISPSDPSRVYAAVTDASNYTTTGLYRSTTGGASWTLVNTTNVAGSQGWYNNAIAVHPTDPFTLYASGFIAYKSDNGGVNLPVVSSGLVHVDHHAIAIDPADPNIVYFGTDGGMYRTTNGGTSFQDLNAGFITTQFYPGFAVSENDSNFSLGGLQDNGTLKYTGSTSWTAIWGADGGWCAIDPGTDDTFFLESQYGRIVRSSGGSFTTVTSGLPGSQSEWNFIPPFVMAPSNPKILYAGARNVYKTTNRGTTWFPANSNPTLNGTTISCIAVSRSSADTLMAGTGTGTFGAVPLFEIFASTNGGSSWTNVTGPLPDRYPTDIEFDPNDSRVAYVTFSGYGTSHLFRTTDLGGSWTDLGAGLPDLPHQCIAVDPVYPRYLYAGTDLGVFQSSDSGSTWVEYNEGLPDAMILDLVVSRTNDALRAATFGSGVYERHLPRFSVLSLDYPAGGENFVTGIVETISWGEMYTSAVNIEYSTNGGTDWISIADSVPAAAGTYAWTIPPTPTTDGFVRVSNADGGNASATNTAPFSIILDPDLLSGWNMVSVPLAVEDRERSAVYPTATSKAFGYQNGYLIQDTLSRGTGYWLKFDVPQFTDFSGDSIYSDSVDIAAGWNMIGGISVPVPVGEIIHAPEGLALSQVFGYRGGYSAVDTLMPGKGYWVKATVSGKLHMGEPAGSPAPSTVPKAAVDGVNVLTVSDAAGMRQRLYFASTEDGGGLPAMELPPPAPGTGGDVRFADATGLVTLGLPDGPGAVKEILSRNLVPPLTISWRVVDGRSEYSLLPGDGAPVALVGSGAVTLASAPGALTIRRTAGTGAGTPERFVLRQNYPNPFNPVTTVSFSLPTDAAVRLSVFDNAGREVAVLTDGPLAAGEHTAEFDASRYASGVYFCRLSTPGGSSTKKMLLLK